jgi:hypothetical protein
VSTSRGGLRSRRGRFVIGLLGLGVLLVAEGWGVYHWWTLGARARGRRGQAEITRPRPAGPTAEKIAAELLAAQREVAMSEAALAAKRAAPSAPLGQAEAYFELAGFVEGYRQRVRTQGVALGPDATHFGFAAYAREGPDLALLGSVQRQQRMAGLVLDALLAANPTAILSLRRELPLTEAERTAKFENRRAERGTTRVAARRASRGEGTDYFSIDPQWSVFAAGIVDPMGLRVVFTGETATLRDFLNGLSEAALPLLARMVEVEPALATEAGEGRRGPAVSAVVPASVVLRENGSSSERPEPAAMRVVARSHSKFTVTLEHVEVLGQESGAMAVEQGGSSPGIRGRWAPPRSPSRGASWVFEVFTPPEITFDPRSNQFAVQPPVSVENVPVPAPFGLELLSVRREPFRVRLIGDVGAGPNRRGVFEDRVTGEVFLAGNGAPLSGLGLEVARVELQREPLEAGVGARAWQPRPEAWVRQVDSGEETHLRVGEVGLANALVATVEANQRERHELRAGEDLVGDAVIYRVEEISLEPISVTVTREVASTGISERRTLLARKDEK